MSRINSVNGNFINNFNNDILSDDNIKQEVEKIQRLNKILYNIASNEKVTTNFLNFNNASKASKASKAPKAPNASQAPNVSQERNKYKKLNSDIYNDYLKKFTNDGNGNFKFSNLKKYITEKEPGISVPNIDLKKIYGVYLKNYLKSNDFSNLLLKNYSLSLIKEHVTLFLEKQNTSEQNTSNEVGLIPGLLELYVNNDLINNLRLKNGTIGDIKNIIKRDSDNYLERTLTTLPNSLKEDIPYNEKIKFLTDEQKNELYTIINAKSNQNIVLILLMSYINLILTNLRIFPKDKPKINPIDKTRDKTRDKTILIDIKRMLEPFANYIYQGKGKTMISERYKSIIYNFFKYIIGYIIYTEKIPGLKEQLTEQLKEQEQKKETTNELVETKSINTILKINKIIEINKKSYDTIKNQLDTLLINKEIKNQTGDNKRMADIFEYLALDLIVQKYSDSAIDIEKLKILQSPYYNIFNENTEGYSESFKELYIKKGRKTEAVELDIVVIYDNKIIEIFEIKAALSALSYFDFGTQNYNKDFMNEHIQFLRSYELINHTSKNKKLYIYSYNELDINEYLKMSQNQKFINFTNDNKYFKPDNNNFISKQDDIIENYKKCFTKYPVTPDISNTKKFVFEISDESKFTILYNLDNLLFHYIKIPIPYQRTMADLLDYIYEKVQIVYNDSDKNNIKVILENKIANLYTKKKLNPLKSKFNSNNNFFNENSKKHISKFKKLLEEIFIKRLLNIYYLKKYLKKINILTFGDYYKKGTIINIEENISRNSSNETSKRKTEQNGTPRSRTKQNGTLKSRTEQNGTSQHIRKKNDSKNSRFGRNSKGNIIETRGMSSS